MIDHDKMMETFKDSGLPEETRKAWNTYLYNRDRKQSVIDPDDTCLPLGTARNMYHHGVQNIDLLNAVLLVDLAEHMRGAFDLLIKTHETIQNGQPVNNVKKFVNKIQDLQDGNHQSIAQEHPDIHAYALIRGGMDCMIYSFRMGDYLKKGKPTYALEHLERYQTLRDELCEQEGPYDDLKQKFVDHFETALVLHEAHLEAQQNSPLKRDWTKVKYARGFHDTKLLKKNVLVQAAYHAVVKKNKNNTYRLDEAIATGEILSAPPAPGRNPDPVVIAAALIAIGLDGADTKTLLQVADQVSKDDNTSAHIGSILKQNTLKQHIAETEPLNDAEYAFNQIAVARDIQAMEKVQKKLYSAHSLATSSEAVEQADHLNKALDASTAQVLDYSSLHAPDLAIKYVTTRHSLNQTRQQVAQVLGKPKGHVPKA